MQMQFETFVENPTAENYQRVLAALRYEPRSPEQLRQLELLFQEGEFREVSRLTQQMMPAWGLSVRVHYLASAAAWERQDFEDAEIERHLWHCCLTGILQTGDGTEDSPYLVGCLGDSQEVLAALKLTGKGLAAKGQALMHQQDRIVECVQCHDGSQIWFDVTGLFELVASSRKRMAKSLLN